MSEHESSIFPRVEHPKTAGTSAIDIRMAHDALLPDWLAPHLEMVHRWERDNPAPAGFSWRWELIEERKVGSITETYTPRLVSNDSV